MKLWYFIEDHIQFIFQSAVTLRVFKLSQTGIQIIADGYSNSRRRVFKLLQTGIQIIADGYSNYRRRAFKLSQTGIQIIADGYSNNRCSNYRRPLA